MDQLLAEPDEPPLPAPPAPPLASTSRLQRSDSSTGAPPPPPPGGPQEQSEKEGPIAEPTFRCFLRPVRPNAQTASVPRPSTADDPPPPKLDFQCFLRPRKARGDADPINERLQSGDHLVGPASTPFAAFGGAQPAGGIFLGPVPGVVLSASPYPAYHLNAHGSNQPYMWSPPPAFSSAMPAPFGAFSTAFSSSQSFGGFGDPTSRIDLFASSSAGSIRTPSSSSPGEATRGGAVQQQHKGDQAVTTWSRAGIATAALSSKVDVASTNRDGAEQTEPDRFTAVPNVAVPGITPSPGSGAGSFAFRPRSVLLASRHDKSPSVSVESPTRPHSPASSAFTNPSHSSTSGTPPVDAPAVSTSPPVFGWPPPAVPLDQSSAAVSVSSEVVSAQQQHPAPVEGADEESADADDDDDEEALRAGLPDGFSLKDLDLGIVTTKVVLQTAKDLKSKKRLIIWLWWDSKKRRWVVVFVWAVQQLQGWMDQVVVRDLGWEPGTFQHHVAVAAATANTPHDRIPTLSGVPIDHTLPHVLDNLLHTADAIIGIGTRGFGANLLSLQEVLARIRPILATRNRGHSPSYHMTAQGFSSAVHDVLTRFGFVAAPGPNKPPEPISLPDLIKLFIEKGGAKGLARDKSNTSELVALDLLGFFAQRVGQSQGKALGNLNGNSERFPTQLFPTGSTAIPTRTQGSKAAEVVAAVSNSTATTGPKPPPSKRPRHAGPRPTAGNSALAVMLTAGTKKGVILCSEPGCEKPAATAKTKLCSQHASRLPETRRDQKYRCPECIFGTNSSKTFDDHIHSAHLIKDYWKCKEPLCGQTFGYFNNLTTHMSTVHSETGGVTCSRTGCDWRSSAAKALEAHERWHDPSHRRDKDRTCSDCRITVTVKGNMDQHLNSKAHKKRSAELYGNAEQDETFRYAKLPNGQKFTNKKASKVGKAPTVRPNDKNTRRILAPKINVAVPKPRPEPSRTTRDLGVGPSAGQLSQLAALSSRKKKKVPDPSQSSSSAPAMSKSAPVGPRSPDKPAARRKLPRIIESSDSE